MEDSGAATTSKSFLERVWSLLAKITKYHAVVGAVLFAVVGIAGYFFFDRGNLRTQNELLQKRLEAEQNQTLVLQGQHSAQVRTYQLQLEGLEKELNAEREYTRNLQNLHERQIETLKIIMSIQGRVPIALSKELDSVMQYRVAQR